ncbi:MAG: TIGR03790 family protein [Chthoniobacterales bacterium]|nr:TIGR03790 family protein [Chthoniobacterales bacterium]
MTDCASTFSAAALVLFAACASLQCAETEGPSREGAATLVVFNTRDPEARALAEYYAGRRSIPAEQVIGLDCPTEEEITREQYTDGIETPLRKLFERKGWWEVRKGFEDQTEVTGSRIRYVALMRGMPLKIRTTIVPSAPDKPAPPRPNGGDPIGGHDEASVDSELSVLGAFREDHFGIVNNPYYRRFAPILDSAVTSGLLLVCRLDAPTADTVRRMIDDSLEAERHGLYGWAYIDRRSIPEKGYKDGDEWLHNAATACWNEGVPVILDNVPAIFPGGFPVTDAALYYGWYEWSLGGALTTSEKPFRPGAVAVHIQSFSASTLRDPKTQWVAPLLTRGAAASMGNVYEPYLDLTPHLDIFNERLLQGFTLAESAYMSIKVLSWMNVVAGDPLYRPFAAAQRGNWRQDPSEDAGPWIGLQKELRKGARSGLAQTLYLSKLARESRSGLNYEALGMLQSFYEEPREALKSLEAAGAMYKSPAESFRTTFERIRILQSIGDKTSALKLVDRTLQRDQPPDRAKLLGDIREEIVPPAPSPAGRPKKP